MPINGGDRNSSLATLFATGQQKHHYTTSKANRSKIFHHVDLPDYLIFAQDDRAENVLGCQKHVQSYCNNNYTFVFFKMSLTCRDNFVFVKNL